MRSAPVMLMAILLGMPLHLLANRSLDLAVLWGSKQRDRGDDVLRAAKVVVAG